LLEVSPLTVAPSNKRVAHVELSLEGSGLAWQPGDSLGLWPENDPRLVERIIELTGADGDEEIERDGQRLALGQWLTRHGELTQVVRPFVSAWAGLAGASELTALLADREAFAAWSRVRQVIDVIESFRPASTPRTWPAACAASPRACTPSPPAR
jgi:sulfite reductase (NADPH) flavoprotein alpha-component